jgi:hypothetical protein
MTTPVFKILINDEHVIGEYGPPSDEPEWDGQADLVLDQLTLATVMLMNRWLSFWDLIESSEIRRKESLLQPDTLEVLGTQLWRLILKNDIGQELKKRIPREGQPPIRLSIELDDQANATLKGLPWEFLFEPDNRWFLATKTELLLTRYVSVEDQRAIVGQVGDRDTIRALLIAALPDTEKFATNREALGKLRTALEDVANLEVPEPISVWDPEKIKGELQTREYHIVHVVGICRGVPGKPEIYLGGDGDGFQDPAVFVDCLTSAARRPHLVILQLCDYVDGDATENFERLAPALIRRQVPAVLALQYAARVDQADRIGLGKHFYQLLVGGEYIGTAVQASRARLREDHPDRRFGTPVLYLQEDAVLRRPGSGIGIDESPARSGTSGGQTVRERLIVELEKRGFRDDEMRPFLDWLRKVGAQLGQDDLRVLVMRKMLDPPQPGDAPPEVYREAYLALKQLGRHHAAA